MTLQLMKKKTLVVLVLLLLLTLSLAAATYSWYIVSTAPSIRAVETYMEVVDPVLSIARATDEKTPPMEVSNQDVRNNPDGTHQDKYYDITWGAIVDSYQNDTLALELPATMDKDNVLKTASISEDHRIGGLVPVKEGKLGYDVDGEYGNYGIRYYMDPDRNQVCAIGLGVWLRINQPDHDLVMSISDAAIKNAAGEVVANKDNIKIGARILSDASRKSEYLASKINPNTGIQTVELYNNEGATGDMPENEPVLVEIIVYMEGNTDEDPDPSLKHQIGLLAKDIDQQLFVNIEKITFYENLDVISQ